MVIQTDIPGFIIRNAEEADCPLILSFIHEFADYVKFPEPVSVSQQDLVRDLFGEQKKAFVLLGCLHDVPIALALYFHTYSTFLGKPGLYLEDLYIKPDFRGRGYGYRVLSYLAQVAVSNGCSRFEWESLNWNKPANEFYQSIGAKPKHESTRHRLDGIRLRDLSQQFKWKC